MNGNTAPSQERLLDLLVENATQGLDTTVAQELDALLASYREYDASHFEPAAAAIDLAMAPPATEALPGALRDRILTDAGAFYATRDTQAAGETAPALRGIESDRVQARSSGLAAWYLAAASLALAVVGWWQVVDKTSPTTATLSQQVADFAHDAADLTRAPWSGQEPGFENVSGEVIWSDAEQRGYMRLVGLTPNDPEVAQYQLWIVDPNRDEHPIDGGVFDVRDSGEVVIPIDAKLQVKDPKVFAITREKPGGVVVSAGPLLVVGAVPS